MKQASNHFIRAAVLSMALASGMPSLASAQQAPRQSETTSHLFTGVFHVRAINKTGTLTANNRQDALDKAHNCRHLNLYPSCSYVGVIPAGAPMCLEYMFTSPGTNATLRTNLFNNASQAQLSLGLQQNPNVPVYFICNDENLRRTVAQTLEPIMNRAHQIRLERGLGIRIPGR